jgi:hypothetical protein
MELWRIPNDLTFRGRLEMWTNRILTVSLLVVGPIVFPLQIVSTLALGILVSLTGELLLIPIDLIWLVCFLGPLLGLSWIWGKIPFLRIPLAVFGIPLALAAETYCCLMPSMGKMDSRISKLLLCRSWPYTLDCLRMITWKVAGHIWTPLWITALAAIVPIGWRMSPSGNSEFWEVFYGICANDATCDSYVRERGL